VRVLERHGDGWWHVADQAGGAGLVPGSYLVTIETAAKEAAKEVAKEAAQIAHRRLSGRGVSPSADSQTVSPM
jgi:hypothetical protein